MGLRRLLEAWLFSRICETSSWASRRRCMDHWGFSHEEAFPDSLGNQRDTTFSLVTPRNASW